MSTHKTLTAKKYAQAFFNVYEKEITANDCTTFFDLYTFFKKNSYCYTILSMKTSSISDDQKKKVCDFLLNHYKAKRPLYTLFNLLIEQGRIDFIVEILAALINEYNARHFVESFIITTSHPLTKPLQSKLVDFIHAKISTPPTIECRLDKSLIAGVRIQSVNYLWEHSIKKDLRKLTTLLFRKGIA